MSIWTRIIKAIEALAKGESLSDVFDKLKAPPERSIAFTIAVIALGAKMAKADGYVTPGEVKAFRQVFRIPTERKAMLHGFSTWPGRMLLAMSSMQREFHQCLVKDIKH